MPPQQAFICPHCGEALTSLSYRAATFGTEWGSASWTSEMTSINELNLDADDSEAGDIDTDSVVYHCPECDEEICADEFDRFLQALPSTPQIRVDGGRASGLQRAPAMPVPRGVKLLSLSGNEDKPLSSNEQETVITFNINRTLVTCPVCNHTYLTTSDADECPHCA